jgi:hypothetical protein
MTIQAIIFVNRPQNSTARIHSKPPEKKVHLENPHESAKYIKIKIKIKEKKGHKSYTLT